MAECFLDLHIVDFCQLKCKHCYLNKGNNIMPFNMVEVVCEDFIKINNPVKRRGIILNGGDPLLHPHFLEICDIVRKLTGVVRLSTNGYLIPKYIQSFRKKDGVQISVDGDEQAHDFIRGRGSYAAAKRALQLLDENNINHSISFTINQMNKHCVDHILSLCTKTGATTLNYNIYQPIISSDLEPVAFKEYLKIREYVKKCAEKEGIHVPETCIIKGCIAGILGVSIMPDGTFWDCSRSQNVIGKFPQNISECLFWDNIREKIPRNQFETCCRRLSCG